jgi:hypothetical protein
MSVSATAVRRYVVHIPTGDLPLAKATAYVDDMMKKMRDEGSPHGPFFERNAKVLFVPYRGTGSVVVERLDDFDENPF